MPSSILENPLLHSLFGTQNNKHKKSPGLVGFQPVTDIQVANPATNKQSQANFAGDVAYLPSQKSAMEAINLAAVERSYQYSETSSLQLTTKEGDTVSLDFRQLYAQYQSYQQMQTAQVDKNSPSGMRLFESRQAMEATQFVEQFAFSVQGDLNEDELKAVFDVFEQVDSLANQFFDGNIEQALQQAMSLKIDFTHLDSFKLNLSQTQTVKASYQQAAVNQYQDVKQQSENGDSSQNNGVNMSELPVYLQTWQNTIDQLNEQFVNARKLVDDFVGQVTSQRFAQQDSSPSWLERVQQFHQQLAEMAQPNKVALENTDNVDENPAIEKDVESFKVSQPYEKTA
ncbi:hypothetical protein [Thiomicrorhabdus sp.]|uniref:hypothetical protein n=1 Tax=Thiomicrorhabdus sp. TaxID=2039724 RepID=UPI002AA66567|nr:hypothetical protein [Thiomicrorhabdus sp.]